jgi:hypothetical protein
MNFGDFMGLVAAMSGLVAIVAILGQGYRRRLEHKERIAELRSQGSIPTAAPAERSAEVEKLEHRIRVLERIATDKTTALASQIEDLRSPVN